MIPKTNFSQLNLNPQLLTVINKLGFLEPTPIQAKSIPVALDGKDLIGIAQTGTGKTLAFGVPMIENIVAHRNKPSPAYTGLKLVVVPTRELALQVATSLRELGQPLGLRQAVVIGGESIQRQIQFLRNHPHIIIGTPGRIIDHLENKNLRLDRVDILVLDEADRMLDMGFAPQIKKILAAVPLHRQTLLFSATMPSDIIGIAKKYMKLPVQIEVAPQGTPAAKISQELFFIHRADKSKLLEKLLHQYHGPILIFTRTKHGARKLTANLRQLSHRVAEIHSNRSLGQRKEALEGFKRGRYRILVATDIAARGIDVKNIALVLNYDLPDNPEDYVHRIGRTARAGESGHAISFATPEEKRDIQRIENLIRLTLPIGNHPDIKSAQPINNPPPKPHGGFGFRRRVFGQQSGRRTGRYQR